MDAVLSSQRASAIWVGLAIVLAILSYFGLVDKKTNVSSRKAQQAKEMRRAYHSIETRTVPPQVIREKVLLPP